MQVVNCMLESKKEEKGTQCDEGNASKEIIAAAQLQPQPVPQHMFPLIRKDPQAAEIYHPFSFTDMNCILDKMPSPEGGGGMWLSKLIKETLSHKIAVGDWRALLCKQTSMWELQSVETEAGTSHLPDSTPFALYATAIGTAMRKRYPVPDGTLENLSFTFQEGQNLTDFLTKSKESWTDIVGNHPSYDKMQTAMFRMAILEAIPKPVREIMLNDPNLPSSTTEYWERHLKHHMKRHNAKREEDKDDRDMARVELLKLQLEEAQKRANDTENKSEHQMVQQPHPQVKRGPREWGRRRQTRWRGQRDRCHACGHLGHWKRMCPNVKWQGIPNIRNQCWSGCGYAHQPVYLLQLLPHHGAVCCNQGAKAPGCEGSLGCQTASCD